MTVINSEELLQKADRAIASARLLLDAGDYEGACNRAYYAMFDAAKAALLALVPDIPAHIGKTHSGLISAFGLHLVKTGILPLDTGRTFNRAFEMRQVADYTGDDLEEADVAWLLAQATDFLAEIKAILATRSLGFAE